jgi:hypothetical protein
MDDSPDRRAAFEAALGNEYFALSGLRAASISEAGTRATLYFTTLTGTLLALGFLAGTTDAVTPVAYAAIPTVVILGFLSFLRLVEIAVEDVIALQAINHIRSYYGQLVPEAAEYFPPAGRSQAINSLLDTGAHRGPWRTLLTISATVGVINTLVASAAVAFALGHIGVHVAIAVACSALLAVFVGWALWRYQTHRFIAAVGPD